MSAAECRLCPRNCGIIREYKSGYCGAGPLPTIARAALHFGEEPCISGTRGSGTIFFTGCSLRCVFCQNHEISKHADTGIRVSVDRLREIMLMLQNMGAHNINLVTPTHFADHICNALDGLSLSVPIAYNSSGYESVDTLKKLKGKVDSADK